MLIYGSKISYYTGKLEAYLRYRAIPYSVCRLAGHERKLIAQTGVSQMPVIDPGQGRWMTDTTPVIAWLEGQQDRQTVYPGDPVLNFIALLIEDYADEWLWRPAMHYRWSFRPDRRHASETLHNEQLRDFLPIPAWAGRALLTYRQLFGFVRGDGVTRQTRDHVESTYHAALGRMQAILVRRPYLLGDAPTIADFGMMGPMFRHFGQDPTPSEIMRETAPAVFEWVARMWNAKPSQEGAGLIAQPDEPLVALLTEACETHLEQLRQNALAFSSGLGCFDQTIQGCRYRRLPVSRYRVWCLEKLRGHWARLVAADQDCLKGLLATPTANVLWDDFRFVPSGYDPDNEAPFNRAINVYGTGVPGR